MKWKGWMAGFKAFSEIHTTGCVFTFSSFLFITRWSDRYTAEISPDEGHVIRGAKYEAPGLTRKKETSGLRIVGAQRRRRKHRAVISSSWSDIQSFKNSHECTRQVLKCTWWSGLNAELVTQNKPRSNHILQNKINREESRFFSSTEET